jgi:hypothetical protein
MRHRLANSGPMKRRLARDEFAKKDKLLKGQRFAVLACMWSAQCFADAHSQCCEHPQATQPPRHL